MTGSYMEESCKEIDVNKLVANQKGCAQENDKCECKDGHVRMTSFKLKGLKVVRGRSTKWYDMKLNGRTWRWCKTKFFGDPEKGYVKACVCSKE
jgi:hypothetical protein